MNCSGVNWFWLLMADSAALTMMLEYCSSYSLCRLASSLGRIKYWKETSMVISKLERPSWACVDSLGAANTNKSVKVTKCESRGKTRKVKSAVTKWRPASYTCVVSTRPVLFCCTKPI